MLIELFNWYKRYKVRAADMTVFQASLLDAMRGRWVSTGPAVLSGLTVISPGGADLSFGVEDGVAVSQGGELLSIEDDANVVLTTPAGNPSRSLIVIRQVITNTDPMVRPTSPGDTVYLHRNYSATIVAIPGTPAANPIYPFGSLQENDVILCGVRLPAGATTANDDNFDFSHRQDIAAGGDYAVPGNGFFDRRMYPYGVDVAQISILPSQTVGASPLKVSYAGGPKPVAFPLSGGVFNPAETVLNFTTGAITGGDGDSPDFTPTIPAAGKFIWAVVIVGTDSLLSVAYGTQGTYAQCKAAMRSQTAAGAGAVPIATGAKICFALVGSSSGAAITEIPEVVDARGPGNVAVVGGAASITPVTGNLVMDGSEDVLEIDATSGNIQVTLPARAANQGKIFRMNRIDGSGNSVTVVRAGADTILGPTGSVTSFAFDLYQTQGFFAGSAKWKITTDNSVVDGSTLQQSSSTLSMKDAGTTRAKLAAAGQLVSSSSGGFSTASATFVDVTNLSQAITVTGRPVKIWLIPDGTSSSFFGVSGTGSTGYLQLLRGSTVVGSVLLQGTEDGTLIITHPPGSFFVPDVPGAGTYTYKLQAKAGSSSTVFVNQCKLYVQEDY